jgi:hypothetical protein
MSVNSCLHRDFVPEIEGLQAIFARYLSAWRFAGTFEDRLIAEVDIIHLFKEVINYSYKLEEVTEFNHLDVVDLNSIQEANVNAIRLNTAKLRSIAELYIEYFNSQQDALSELIGLLRRGRQTLSTLRLWDRTNTKWVVSEAFLNLDQLDSNYTSLPLCNINTSGGYLTLPVSTTSNVNPATNAIGSGSNGFSGNSNYTEVSTNDTLPRFCFDGKADTWFEYEKFDSGPLRLNLVCQLNKADIVNGISIESLNFGEGMDFVVADITYSSVSGKTLSLHDLVSPSMPDDFNVVKTVGNDTFWEIAHMPVRCKSITIKFEQENAYFVKFRTQDGRVVQRPRYAIGIKNIELKQHRYKSEGGINSIIFAMMSGIYATNATVDVFPRGHTLFSANLNASVDGGENWINDVLNLPETQGETILCDGEEFNFAWSLALTRNDDVFSEATSFTDEEVKIETDSLLRRVSPTHNPAEFQLSEKPYNKEVFVIQPKVARKVSGSAQALDLGVIASTAEVSLPLPFSIIDEGLDPAKLRVYARRIELTRVNDKASLASDKYFITPDYKYLILKDIEPGSMIKYAFDVDRLLFTERSDGYYAKFETLFDPDIENINLTRLPSFPSRKSIMVPPGKQVIPLGYKNLSSLELQSENGTTYNGLFSEQWNTQANSPAVYAHLFSNSSPSADYFVDMVNGILYFKDKTTTQLDNIKVTFLHSTDERLSSDSFSVWYDKIKPVGIVVRPEAMITKDVSENPFAATNPLSERIDPITGVLEVREDIFASANTLQKWTLSHEYIVMGSVILGPEIFDNPATFPAPQESPYVDGYTEFLGLLQMEEEFVPEIQTTTNTTVQFKLAAREAWHSPLGIAFSGANSSTYFANRETLLSDVIGPQGTLGKYHISSGGLVTVYVGANSSLPAGISMYYSYKDPTHDLTNRFSVDYMRGLLFLSQPLLATPAGGTVDATKRQELSIGYKVAGYTVGYDVAIENNSYTYNPTSNSVTVRTENIKSWINKQIKIIWGKSPEEGEPLEELKGFFSPIMTNIGFRFT